MSTDLLLGASSTTPASAAIVILGAVAVAVVAGIVGYRLGRRHRRSTVDDHNPADAIIGASTEGVVVLDASRTVTSANEAAAQLVGLPLSRIVGATAGDLVGSIPVLHDPEPGRTEVESIVHGADGMTRSVLVTSRSVGEGASTAFFLRDVTARKALEERLVHQAMHDDLTGLANRASMLAELDRAVARSERSGHGFGLLFVDLDRFKAVNDTLGHRAGDIVLRHVADRLGDATRDTDLVARIGGDEFVVVAEEAGDVSTVVRLAERIQAELSDPLIIESDTVTVSASIGVAWIDPTDKAGLDQLRDADLAMYRAKSAGPGQIRVFDDDMRHWVEQRFDLERELRRAVGAGELDAHVQPVIDLRTGAVVGGELLCRWTTDDGREVPPEAFIEVAEDSTLVVEIGRWMLDRAASVLSDWQRVGGLDLRLSVNLSGRHIDHPNVVEDVSDVCSRWSIDPSRLVIEITETSLLNDLEEASRRLQAIRDVGVEICVDDFGVGYASLRYLRELPVGQVKIDRSIVAGFGRVDSDTVIVTMLARLAEVLQIQVVAEGIETEEQRERLGELGCHLAQGYLFAKAMPTDAFPMWLARWRRKHTHPSAWATIPSA